MNKFTMEEYVEASALAREVGERMLSRLEIVTLQPKVVLDVGCRVNQLKNQYPDAEIITTDTLLKDHSVDLIFANLLLPWCDDLQAVSEEWRRILRPEGLLMFATFGPDTLLELQEKTDINFKRIDMHEVGDVFTKGGWIDPVLDVEYITVTYKDSKKLAHELQVTNMITQDLAHVQLEKNSQLFYPLTYEIVYGHAWGPGKKTSFAADEEGVARIPLSHLRRRRE